MLKDPPHGAHILQFCDSDEARTGARDLFIEAGLLAGDRVFVLEKPEELGGIKRSLDSRGVDLALYERRSQFRIIDHSSLLNHRHSESESLAGELRSKLGRTEEAQHHGLRLWDTFAGLYFESGRFEEASKIEAAWNKIRDETGIATLCPYSSIRLNPQIHSGPLWEILHDHSYLIPGGSAGLAFEVLPARKEEEPAKLEEAQISR